LSSDKVTSVLEDRSGTLWFGTNGGGACRYDGNLFTHFTTVQGLAYNEVKGIAEDKAGNLWLATWGGGVSRYDGKKFENYSLAQGLKSNNLFSILIDSKGNIWLGADNGVSKYDGKTFTGFDTSQGFTNSQVWGICEDNNHDIWFATFGDGVFKYDGNSFTHFSRRQGLSNPIVMSLLQDRKGNMWFGTYGSGVYKYDGKTFTNFNQAGGLSSDEVMDMMEDRDGNLWIGTIGGGVNKFDGKSFTHYSTAQGLSNEIVMGILQDREGNIWFSTRNGFNRMMNTNPPNTSQNLVRPLFRNYLFEDGFLGVNAYVNALYQDHKGNIWIGTGDRLTCCHPQGEIPDTIAPAINLTTVSLYNEKINWQELKNKKDATLILANGVEVKDVRFDSISRWYNVPQHVTLSHDNNYLVFSYIGIHMRSPYSIRYQYMLEGIDENWNALTDRTEAPYGNIPYGYYTFKVKAMNSEGYWSKEYAYSFEILPAWWQMMWFRILVIFVAIVALYGFYRYRLQQVMRLQNIRNRIAGDLHDDIGSTLNSISVFSEVAKNDPLKRNDSLGMIGESSRKVIDSMSDIVWTINPENDSFESIILRMRSLAFNLLRAKNIEFSFQANESLNHIKLSMERRRNFFLIFKEALNNLVKYSDATQVTIQLLQESAVIKLIIHDNGKGFNLSQPSNGNGLNNMKRRAKEMKTQLKMESTVGEGTYIELLLKL
jgi:streptogramin lyase/two-component sensor histidine kinase